MTPRENLLSLLRREGYEWAPCQLQLCPALEERFRTETGVDASYEDHFDFPWRKVGKPVLPREASRDWSAYYADDLAAGTTYDVWGVAKEPGSAAAMHMRRMHHPMRAFDSLEQFEAYPLPDFENASYDHVAVEVEELHGRGLAATFVMSDLIWEIAFYLRGMEELMMEMALGDDKALFLLDRLTELACFRAERYARGGVDVLHTGDDVGMQSRMMMSPAFWRQWLKPRLARVIRAAKDARPEILFSYHSCGYVEPIIDDLIEVGVDILNPVQPESMDFGELHAKFGDRLSFWGTLGTQTTMPFGSPEEVRTVVRRNLTIAGEQGGLLCAPTHMLEPEVPWENIEAYISACQQWAGSRKGDERS